MEIYVGIRLSKGEKILYQNKYRDLAVWCNLHNAHIEDKGDYYEIVENKEIELTKEEKIKNLELQIEKLNQEMVRDILIIWDKDSSADKKTEAQEYFNIKKERKNAIIEEINKLK